MSFVYAFQLDNGIKIGKADNTDERKRTFQTINTKEIYTICILETHNSLFYEEMIHKFLDKYRNSKREMFECSHELIISVFDSIRMIITNLDKEETKKIDYIEKKSTIDDEKFMLKYNLNKKHVEVFYNLQKSIFNNFIYIDDFKSFIKKNKLVYYPELYNIFKKYLLFINNHSIYDIESNQYEFIITHLEYNKHQKIHCKTIWDLYKYWCLKFNTEQGKQSDLETRIQNFFNLPPKKRLQTIGAQNRGWHGITLIIK
jgi:hypothetical protein